MSATKSKRSLCLPIYALIPVVFILWFHGFTYDTAGSLAAGYPGSSLATPLDNMWPFWPVWIIVYIAAYVVCPLNYIIGSYGNKKNFYTLVTAYILIHVLAALFYYFMPVYVNRPDVSGDGFFIGLVRQMYLNDQTGNCFPSLHCACSLLGWLAVKDVKSVPKGYKVFSLIFCILVCLSTLFCKEHYIADVCGGLGFTALFYWLAGKFNWYKPFMSAFEWVNGKVWGAVTQKKLN